MKRWMMALGASLVTLGGARCAPVVSGGADQSTATGTSSGTSSGTSTSSSSGTSTSASGGGSSPAGGGPTTAIAMLFKDVPNGPAGQPPADFSQGSLSEGSTDPSSLVLLFSNGPQTCDNPAIGAPCPSTLMWQAAFVVPPDLVRVGLVDLGNPRIGWFSWQFVGSGGQCGGGGGGGFGPGMKGTLDILSADASSLGVKLSGGVIGASGFTVDGVQQPTVVLDGSYVADRCDAPPPPPSPSTAVAIRGSSLPAGLPSNPTIGDTPDPTALYVFLGTGTQTCAAPLSPLGCTGDGRFTLRIPESLQQPGTIDLSDPRLAASVEIAGDNGEGSGCSSSSATSFNVGTLTITSADANGLTFSLYQSLVVQLAGPVARRRRPLPGDDLPVAPPRGERY